jgi:hypothetical protein
MELQFERSLQRVPAQGRVYTNAEVRTPHLTMVDNHGKTLFEAQCIDDHLYLKDYASTVSNFGKW